MANGDKIILFANGNTSVNSGNGMWTSTNNKGKRKAKRVSDNVEFEMESIPAALDEDEETKSKQIFYKFMIQAFILKRED